MGPEVMEGVGFISLLIARSYSLTKGRISGETNLSDKRFRPKVRLNGRSALSRYGIRKVGQRHGVAIEAEPGYLPSTDRSGQ